MSISVYTFLQVSFRLSVGDLKPSKVTVVLYGPVGNKLEYQCKNQKKGIWAVKENVPGDITHYNYIAEIGPKSNYKFWEKVKEFVVSATPYQESSFRSLPSTISTCRDVFEPPPDSGLTESVLTGLTTCHLQHLVDSVKSINDLKRSLHELEHLSRVFKGQLFMDETELKKIRQWIGKPFISYSRSHNLVLLSALYGRLAGELGLHIRDVKGITAPKYREILGAIQTVEPKELTKWSHEWLRVTAREALEASKKDHWIYVAANFPHLFKLHQLMDLSEQMNKKKLQPKDLRLTIIPRIQDGYSKDEADTILHKLLKTTKAGQQITELQEVVEEFINPVARLVDVSESSQEIPKPDVDVVSPAGDTSNTNELADNEESHESSVEVSTMGAWSNSENKGSHVSV